LGSIRFRWGTVTVVVGGFTSTQGGWESQPQGEGPQVGSFDVPRWTEVLDLDGCYLGTIEHPHIGAGS
jgi:hypothetical protein